MDVVVKYDHFLNLRKDGKYIAIAMPVNCLGVDYGKSIVKALLAMIDY